MVYLDDLIGAKYKENGRSKTEGFDCYGYAIEVEKRIGHILPDLEEIKSNERDVRDCEIKCLAKINVKEVSTPQIEGDILLLKDGPGILGHIGVYLGNDMFTHCNKHGAHIENIRYYKNLIGRVYTWQ